MRVCLYSKILTQSHLPFVEDCIKALMEEGVFLLASPVVYEFLIANKLLDPEIVYVEDYEDFKQHKVDILMTLGGDGTVLNAVTFVRDSNVPILGVNLGRLGFLTTTNSGKIKSIIKQLDRKMYHIEERSLLYLESNLPIFADMRFALNDFTILKRDTSSMIVLHTYVNGEFLNSYWADGVIVSTPTGSTGYNLSCGGPIVFPTSKSFVLTPVAPHNLNVRPLVISDDAVISFEVEGRSENFLCTLDSRYESIHAGYQLAIRKCDFSIRLIQLSDRSFLHNMREKLKWGDDSRNKPNV